MTNSTDGLGIVNIVQDQYVAKINELADLLGKGPCSLSRKLQDSDGNIWWGCHSSAWIRQDYEDFVNPIVMTSLLATGNLSLDDYVEPLQNLKWFVKDLHRGYSALYDNWYPALEECGLVEVIEVP